MRFDARFRTLAASAAATALLLSACGGTDAEESATPSPTVEVSETTIETSEPVEPTEEETTEEETTEEATPEAEESPVEQESLAAQPTSTRDPVVTGALDGGELNADAVAWFDKFCSGVTEAKSYAEKTPPGQSIGEVTDFAATTYRSMGTSLAASSDRLSVPTEMNFENADAFATEVSVIMEETGKIYWAGADTMESETFTTEQDFLGANQEISESIILAGGFDFGIPSLDSTVSNAVAEQVPSCGVM